MESGDTGGMGTLDVVGTVETDGTVYKIVEFQPGGGELQVEQIGHHHHLATTEDGTLIHVRTIDGTSQSIPIRFHHSHGTEEAATLLRLQDFAQQETEELMQAGDEEEEQGGEEQELKVLAHHGPGEDEDGSQDEAEVSEQQENEQQQYLQLFTAGEAGVVDADGEAVEIHLNMEHGTPHMDLHSIITGAGINVSEGLSYDDRDDDGVGEVGGGLVLSSGKIKEPSTAAALDLGCEWSLTLPFGFQGQGLNEQCQKLILNVWHYFKHLKKYPELMSDKNAQGLAGDALNVGTKTIGRIGKAFRTGKLQEIQEYKLLQNKKRKRSSGNNNNNNNNSKVREALKGRKIKKTSNGGTGSDDERNDTIYDDGEDEVQPGPSGRGRGRGGRGATSTRGVAGRGRGAATSRGGGARGGKKMVQTTLPVNVKAVYGTKASTSAVQFDSD